MQRLRSMWAGLAFALAAAGCGGGDVGYAVRLRMSIDPTVTDAEVDRVKLLELEVVSSAERWYSRLPTDGRFGGRSAKIVYRPLVEGGTLPFSLRLRDAEDKLLGEGAVSVTLVQGKTVEADVRLGKPVLGDGGSAGPADLGYAYDDLAVPADLASAVDMARRPDMAMPTDSGMGTPDMAMGEDLLAPQDMTSTGMVEQ
jgi:hypothetical protein